jgi:hypothetical protein
VIREAALAGTFAEVAEEVSATIAAYVREQIAAGEFPRRESTIVDLAVRTAWQIGLETGLTIADIDRLGAAELLEAIAEFIQERDPVALASSRQAARGILEGVQR